MPSPVLADQQRPKRPDELRSGQLLAVYQLWRSLAGERFAPSRREILPAQLKAQLSSVFLIDVIDEGADFRFSLGGQRIVDFMGGVHAGRLLSEFGQNPFYDRMRGIYQTCCKSKSPLAVGPLRTLREGREYLDMEVVVLPLSDDGMRVSALLGGMHLSHGNTNAQ